MKVNLENKVTNFGSVPAAGIFSYNGDIFIALTRGYTDDDEIFNAVDLRDGSVINMNDDDIVTYYSNATLNL